MPRCGLCNGFERKPRDYRIAFDSKPSRLDTSTRAGCPICTFLRDGIAHFEPRFGTLSHVRRVYVWGSTVDGDGSVEVELYLDDSTKLRLEFFVGADSTRPFNNMKSLPVISGDTASEASFSWVCRVLGNCIKTHSRCNRNTITELPTRVLDLGPPERAPDVRLFEPSGALASYACLSHCWGKARSITTERKTLASHRDGIAWGSLPKTFRDTINFVRKLDLRYLWIDSLCIIQDDIDDWRRESAKMASIYQNSYITIAATKSADDHGGCYSTASPFDLDYPLTMKLSEKVSQATLLQVYVREKILHFDDMQDVNASTAYPLLTRGWAYQERLLAPRVLHFCQKELVWECQEFTRCECSCFNPAVSPKQEHSQVIGDWAIFEPLNPEERQSEIKKQPYGEIRKLLRMIPRAFHGKRSCVSQEQSRPADDSTESQPKVEAPLESSHEQSEVYNPVDIQAGTSNKLDVGAVVTAMWHKIISEYSHLALSVEGDRLPAIAGLARQTESCKTGKYLAGLWEDSLAEDLLWRVDEPLQGQSQRRPESYRAPSWSWASVNSKVSFWEEKLGDYQFRIVNAECTPVRGADCFGQVTSGYLEVLGKLTAASVLYTGLEDRMVDSRHYKLAIEGETVPFYADYCLCGDGKGKLQDKEEVYCLGNFSGERFIASLVVRKLECGSKYERIGIVARPLSSKVRVGITVTEVRDLAHLAHLSTIVLV
ncbi:HET-domain-containing protein [Glonium stellatum]|uniref:HET-domain-containing protein n=1 Tax=Glonium stellatum TaxID=574774 RepID=A0A8E2F0G4_9PEZI|nr:HET-domain-containing protein [Glonium stellatum]